jgi:hypothetical protein
MLAQSGNRDSMITSAAAIIRSTESGTTFDLIQRCGNMTGTINNERVNATSLSTLPLR